jgi:hypothetical protein
MAHSPGSDAGGMPTDQRTCGFYLSWFFKLYEANDSGWWARNTPDGLSIGEQDSYFWRALEVVAQIMNEMRSEEMARINQG